jgi:hypothetical protein
MGYSPDAIVRNSQNYGVGAFERWLHCKGAHAECCQRRLARFADLNIPHGVLRVLEIPRETLAHFAACSN